MQPRSNHDWRPAHARPAMHQQVSAPDADRHREHNVLKLLRRDRARVWDWDVNVGDFRSSVNGPFPAERNDGGDALRIRLRQLLRIFQVAEIEPFPNPRHCSPSRGRHAPAASLSPTSKGKKANSRVTPVLKIVRPLILLGLQRG